MNNYSIEGAKPLNNLKHVLKIMRTAFFLLFFAILYTQASIGYSQGAELSLDLKSASIKEICEEIERKSDFRFLFSGNAKTLSNKKVDIKVSARDIEEILNAMLADTEFSYKIIDKQVVIYHDSAKTLSKQVEEIVSELSVEQQKNRSREP